MKPKNKAQKEILTLGKKMPKISAAQKAWAFNNCFPRLAYRTKKEYVCFECGHRWPNKGEENTCPACGSKFELLSTKARSYTGKEYFAILTVRNGFQVVRNFWVEKRCKVGMKASYFISEVAQLWFDTRGDVTIIAKKVAMSYFYCDLWRFESPMEIRRHHQRYSISPFVYPRQKVLPVFRRNGFTGETYGISAYHLFPAILNDSRAETLLKAKQGDFLGNYLYRYVNIGDYWPQVKICIRNNYIIPDTKLWSDMIDNLEFLGKDIRNSHYICPADIKQAHDYWMEKRSEFERKKDREEKIRRIREAEAEYQREKQKFFDLHIKSKDIEIAPLKSVEEFLAEGNEMHHCVFENEYFKKAESLILSAKKDGKRLETVEVSLAHFDVRQSRGKCNQETEFHKKIVSTVKRNMNKIRELAEAI